MSTRPLSAYKKDISNGIWFFIHVMGEAAKTPELMRAYAFNFRNMCDKMGCSCENHCKQMLIDHPPEHYFSMVDKDGVPCGCFYHSVMCHNMVNERLGKPTYTYDQIYPLFRGPNAHSIGAASDGGIKPCTAPSASPVLPTSLSTSSPASLPTKSVAGSSSSTEFKPLSLDQLSGTPKKLTVNTQRRRAGIRIMDA